MDLVGQHTLLFAAIVVILFFIIMYVVRSKKFSNSLKNLGLIKGEATTETKKPETLDELQEDVKKLNEELKIAELKDKINKIKKTETKTTSNNFFDTGSFSDMNNSNDDFFAPAKYDAVSSNDDFFDTDVQKDIMKGGKK